MTSHRFLTLATLAYPTFAENSSLEVFRVHLLRPSQATTVWTFFIGFEHFFVLLEREVLQLDAACKRCVGIAIRSNYCFTGGFPCHGLLPRQPQDFWDGS
jgi:hypothetical protein